MATCVLGARVVRHESNSNDVIETQTQIDTKLGSIVYFLF